MKTDAEKLIESTMEYALRPRRGDRAKVISAVLEHIIYEYGYMFESYDDWVIDVVVLEQLIEELRTVDEATHKHCRRDLDVL